MLMQKQRNRQDTNLLFLLRCCTVLAVSMLGRDSHAAQPSAPAILYPAGEDISPGQKLGVLSVERVNRFVFDTDGRILASLTEDGMLCVWRLEFGHPERCMHTVHDPKVRATALGIGGPEQHLLVGLSNGSVQMWTVHGERTDAPCSLSALDGDSGALSTAITAIWTVPNSAALGAVAAQNGRTRICRNGFDSSRTGAEPQQPRALPPLAGLPGSLFDRAVVDRKGELIVVAKDHRLGAWQVETGNQRWLEQRVTSLVGSLALSADGARLATGHLDGGIQIWDPQRGHGRRLPDHHKHPVHAIAFSQDGSRLAAGAEDGVISVWDARTLAHLMDLESGAPIEALGFTPDGRVASASMAAGITLWDLSNRQPALTFGSSAHRVRSVAFSSGSGGQGTLLATASADGKVRLWKRTGGVEGSSSGGLNWTLLCRAEGLRGKAVSLVFQPQDGQVLAAVGDGRALHLWSTADCSPVTQLRSEHDLGWLRSVAFSPDGQRLAVGSQQGAIQTWIWRDGAWKPEQQWKAHADEIGALAFVSADGRLLVSGSLDKTVGISKLGHHPTVQHLPAQAQGITTLSVGKDGKRLYVTSGTHVSLWDLELQKSLGKLELKQPVAAAQMSPDATQVATLSRDGLLQVWNWAEQRLIRSIDAREQGDETGEWGLAWSPDGALLATASLGRIDLWNVADTTRSLPMNARLWQGHQDWAVFVPGNPTGKLFRSDTGGLLWVRTANGGITPLLPPSPDRPPEFQLTFKFEPTSDSGFQLGTLTAQLSNGAKAGPAYWVRLDAVDSANRTDLQTEVSLELPAILNRLDPAKTEPLAIPVRDRKKRWLPPRSVRFCLAVRHAFDPAPIPVCMDGESQSMYPVSLSLGPWGWRNILTILPITGVLLLLLGAGLLWRSYQRALSQPLIRRIKQGQNPLRELVLSELPDAEATLRFAAWSPTFRALRQRAFAEANIDQHGWTRALRAARSPEDCAQALAASISSRPVLSLQHCGSDLVIFSLGLPPLSIHVPREVPLIVVATQSMSPQQAISQMSPEELGHPDLALLVDRTQAKQARDVVRQALSDSHSGTTFVLISEAELTRLLLSRDEHQAKDLLRRLIIEQSDLKNILPYRDGGNEIPADESSFFFGRRTELETLLQLRHRNFLLVGPRLMGKSSLLNALGRQISCHHPSSRVIKVQLFDSSLRALPSIEPAIRVGTPEEFHQSVMAQPVAHLVFLLDEVDSFVAADAVDGFVFCNVMRALSGQGKASFVLAGHQALHEAVCSPSHPLRNFGQLLRLGPLDPDAAKQMILDPITALGLRISDEPMAVDWLREQTGCRPHLLAMLCVRIARLRQPFSDTPLTLEEIQNTALSPKSLLDAFEWWKRDQTDPLDRVVMRLALLYPQSRKEELLRRLREQGVPIDEDRLEKTLVRLYAWHYALVADDTGRLYCPVPLLRFMLTDLRSEQTGGRRWISEEQRLRDELETDLVVLRTAPAATEAGLEDPVTAQV